MNTPPSGPKTEAGKSRSRLNACKHGLQATDDLFIQHLNPQERQVCQDLRASLHDEYKPQTLQEKLIVDRLAIQNFRMMRLYHFEVLAADKSEPNPLAPESVIPHLDRFARYDRQIACQIRTLHNHLKSLYITRNDFSLTTFQPKN